MKTLLVLLFSLVFTFGSRAQSDPATPAQAIAAPVKYLALDVSGPFGGFHRYRFQEGDRFSFRARTDRERYHELLYAVTDTSFSLSMMNEVMNRPDVLAFQLGDVQRVYVNRRIPFVSAGAIMLPLAGLVFIVADFVNPKAGDGKSGRFVFDSRSLIPGGALIALGGLCYKLSAPRYTVNKNHRLRVLTAL